jgi:hypothetical protein
MGTGRDRDIAAAYLSPLSVLACGAKFGIGRTSVKAALRRTGTPVRRHGPLGWPYPWAGRAAVRHAAGERVGALAREYGVDPKTMRRAIERQGITVIMGPPGRPRGGGT